jgi:nucleolar pre-ribosomal-associated protein 2
MIFGAAFSIFQTRATPLDDMKVITKDDLDTSMATFKDGLLEQLKDILHKSRKDKSNKLKAGQKTERLMVLGIIDALAAVGIDSSKLAALEDDAKAFCTSVQDTELQIGKRLETFLAVHGPDVIEEKLLAGDVSTVNGRQSITQTTIASMIGKDKQTKLKLLDSIFGPGLIGLVRLDKLLAARQVIISIEDARKSAEGEDQNEEKEKEGGTGFDLSEAYSILCGNLWKVSGVRQFCVISETLELMLRTKVTSLTSHLLRSLIGNKTRSMTQFNIDTTLGSITILCSRNSPLLRPSRAGTIYFHLCRLLQSVLTHHRLKLQGHFHLVVQVMQSLLRLLFRPLPYSTAKALKHFGSPPSWLSSPKYQLNAKHAAAFTRLVTLICDPSVSSVRGSQHNNLTSATDKAKRMAGQHMQFLLTTYIKLQLEMRMLPEIREKMIPGLYAIFDTTTPELRRVINDELDASGRAVFGTLYKDYARFGKWKGN